MLSRRLQNYLVTCLILVTLYFILTKNGLHRHSGKSDTHAVLRKTPDPDVTITDTNIWRRLQKSIGGLWRSKSDKLTRFSLDVSDDDINRFSVKLPPLLPHYKNPCWLEEVPKNFSYDDSYYNQCEVSGPNDEPVHQEKFRAFESNFKHRMNNSDTRWRIRCFPYFFVLGLGKSGTTDFYVTIHDFVADVLPSFIKETHFWEWKRSCKSQHLCKVSDFRNPTFAEYLDTYDASSEIILQTVSQAPDGTPYHPLVTGDFSPSTLTFDLCWRQLPGNEHLDEPRYTTPHYIYAIRPQTKFIIIVRDPVERVYSNYRMRDRIHHVNGTSNIDSFHNQISETIANVKECFRARTPRACAYDNMSFDMLTHVTSSLYQIFLQDWMNVFPRDQFLVIRTEDYSRSREEYLKKTIKFLELPAFSPKQEWLVKTKLVNNDGGKKSDMREDTRALMQAFFRPFNHRLAELLGDQRFTWGY